MNAEEIVHKASYIYLVCNFKNYCHVSNAFILFSICYTNYLKGSAYRYGSRTNNDCRISKHFVIYFYVIQLIENAYLGKRLD